MIPDPLDIELCNAAAEAYAKPSTFIAAGDVHAVLTGHDGMIVVAFRGTEPDDWADWFRDFAAWPHTARDHPALGPCHDGFLTGGEAMLPALLTVLTPSTPFAVTGHSLGGSLAKATAGLLIDSGCFPVRLTTFGAARVGFGLPGSGMTKLAKLIAPIPGFEFRKGIDPVPEVPPTPYRDDRAWTRIGQPSLVRIEDHFIAGYLAELTAMAPA